MNLDTKVTGPQNEPDARQQNQSLNAASTFQSSVCQFKAAQIENSSKFNQIIPA